MNGIAGLGEMEGHLERVYLHDLDQLETAVELGPGRSPLLTSLRPTPQQLIAVDPDVLEGVGFTSARVGTAESIPLDDVSVDLIVARWVLEHIADPHALAGEVARVLRPGGRFAFITPNRRHGLFAANRALQRVMPFTLARRLVSGLSGRDAPDVYRARYLMSSVNELSAAFSPYGTIRADVLPGSAYGLRWGKLVSRIAPARLPFIVGCFYKRDA